ncbi:MAG: 7-carboxy-7-deazaguanine synthase QueE [Thermonemataceae bacterium]
MEVVTQQALPLMEAFYTLQGEGYYQGQAAYFIRLGGCDVGCVWCDVKDSWDATQHPLTPIEAIVDKALQHPARLVVITGGEPLMYDLTSLTQALKEAGFQINVETSGAYPLSGHLDWICFSPKKFKAPLEEFFQASHELKVVIYHTSDLAWAASLAAKMHDDCTLYLQPEWSKANQMLPLIVDYVKLHPRWRVSLQTHKYMEIP